MVYGVSSYWITFTEMTDTKNLIINRCHSSADEKRVDLVAGWPTDQTVLQ